jgi:biopolymer transport protein TolR
MDSPANRHRAYAPMSAEPNVTPMIDVLMVLLIIFFAAVGRGVFEHSNVQLPVEDREAPGLPIILEVGPGGAYAINRQPVPPDKLEARLRAIYAGRSEKVITVKGDPAAKYHEVFRAVDVAKSAGVTVVSIAPKGCCP